MASGERQVEVCMLYSRTCFLHRVRSSKLVPPGNGCGRLARLSDSRTRNQVPLKSTLL